MAFRFSKRGMELKMDEWMDEWGENEKRTENTEIRDAEKMYNR